MFTGHRRMLTRVAIAPDEKQIVAGDADGRVMVWDVERAQPMVTLAAGNESGAYVDWSPDGKRIAAAYQNGTVQIWTLPRSP